MDQQCRAIQICPVLKPTDDVNYIGTVDLYSAIPNSIPKSNCNVVTICDSMFLPLLPPPPPPPPPKTLATILSTIPGAPPSRSNAPSKPNTSSKANPPRSVKK